MSVLSKIRMLILGLLLIVVTIAKAQPEKVNQAIEFFEKNQLDSAKVYIDIAILHPESANDAQSLYIRGIIYTDIYKKTEKGNKMSSARIEALNALRQSIMLDENKDYLKENINIMKYLLATMHNDVVDALDLIEYQTAIDLFRKEQEYYKIIDPSVEANKAREIEFALALGSVYNAFIESGKDSLTITKFTNLAKALYTKILILDPNNVSANYSLGILYYNQAVRLIKSEDYDVDIALFQMVQDQSSNLFKNALPYMKKTEELEPTNENAILGLAGIYFGLYETEKSNIYRKKLEEIKKNKKE